MTIRRRLLALSAAAVILLGPIILLGDMLREDAPSPGESSPTLVALPSSSPGAAVVAANTSQPSASVETPKAMVTGLSSEPQPPSPVRQRVLPPARPSVFAPWDGRSTVIYDVQTGREINLGPGDLGSFSPDSELFAWTSGVGEGAEGVTGDISIIDLTTGTATTVGYGRSPRFRGRNLLVYDSRDATGPGQPTTIDVRTMSAPSDLDIAIANAYEVILRRGPRYGYQVIRDGAISVVDVATGDLLLRFSAEAAIPAGPNEILVAAFPTRGVSNLYFVSIETGLATFVTTGVLPGTVASATHVFWSTGPARFCEGAGEAFLYSRAMNEVFQLLPSTSKQLDFGFVAATFTPGGLLAVGLPGARGLIDPVTLESVVTILEAQHDAPNGGAEHIFWSRDYRYASRGWMPPNKGAPLCI